MRRGVTCVVLAAALLAGAAGCSSAAAPPADPSEDRADPLTREAALASARQDAYQRFGARTEGMGTHRRGDYWVIELRREDGGGLRYAISAEDGSIRERSTFQ